VRPLSIGNPAHGNRVPDWFGDPDADGTPRGVVLTGRALMSAGLQAPASYPERVWLLEVAATD
jgi:alpha-galactosidase